MDPKEVQRLIAAAKAQHEFYETEYWWYDSSRDPDECNVFRSAFELLDSLVISLSRGCSLLRMAACPNPECIQGVMIGRLRENMEQCEFCDVRKKFLEEHE